MIECMSPSPLPTTVTLYSSTPTASVCESELHVYAPAHTQLLPASTGTAAMPDAADMLSVLKPLLLFSPDIGPATAHVHDAHGTLAGSTMHSDLLSQPHLPALLPATLHVSARHAPAPECAAQHHGHGQAHVLVVICCPAYAPESSSLPRSVCRALACAPRQEVRQQHDIGIHALRPEWMSPPAQPAPELIGPARHAHKPVSPPRPPS
eukprot:SAG25_NODE_2098_length_1956_cov_10.702208_1_plen_207_part_10